MFASAYWALLPLVARSRVSGGPEIYGLLLGTIGLGAVAGAFVMPSLKLRIGPDRLVAVASIGTAVALTLFGIARDVPLALLASLIAGGSWIAAIATVNVSAQVALPDWVRGRGLAMDMTVLFGSITLGSVVWGEVAAVTNLSVSHLAAAAGILVAIPLTWRWKLQTGEGLDLTPSMQWPAPTARSPQSRLTTDLYLISPSACSLICSRGGYKYGSGRRPRLFNTRTESSLIHPRRRSASATRPSTNAASNPKKPPTSPCLKGLIKMETTWKPHEKHGDLTMKSDLPDSVFAFPNERKEPLTDAQHVRNAVSRFDQVIGVSDEERARAFANIEKAASYYGVDLSETSWRQLGVHPQPHREESARKGAETRMRERALE